MPKEMAHSHLGMATDGRYIYIVNGQYGPQCRGPTSDTFVLDTETKQWSGLPPLPVPRYVYMNVCTYSLKLPHRICLFVCYLFLIFLCNGHASNCRLM